MTTIRLHGILALEFGEYFEYGISKPKEALHAINSNKKGFLKRIKNLHEQGFIYTIIVDGVDLKQLTESDLQKTPKNIDILPIIMGSGWGTIAYIATQVAIDVVVAAISYGLMLLLAPKEPEPPTVEASTRAIDQSFSFSNKANIATQGSGVPLGYGRLKVGTYTVQYTTKNFPQSYKPMELNDDGPNGSSSVL